MIEPAAAVTAGRDSTLVDMLSLSTPRFLSKSPVYASLLARISRPRPIFDFPAGDAS